MPNEATSGPLTPAGFVAKWQRVSLPERAASQEHFLDLCRLLGQPTPGEQDPTGDKYTFEKGVSVTGGASRGSKGEGGYADVWCRGKFAWEYKRKDKYKTLTEAYRQLCQYREALENPPLLVVSDISRTEIHTNFTGTAKRVYAVKLNEIDTAEGLSLLRRVFTEPESFRPTISIQKVTEQIAESFASVAGRLQVRGHEPHAAAKFLMKCMFCMFAEDTRLLPRQIFSRLLDDWHEQPEELTARLTELFDRMRTGGAFGIDRIARFNGGLFDESPALSLEPEEIDLLRLAAVQDWGSVEPAIFGTLFERSLDPAKRAQIGAHYTSREDILLIVEPVVMAPLRRQWASVQADVHKQIDRRRTAKTAAAKKKCDGAITDLLQGFLQHLGQLRILDPACGSGNFLYVAIQQLLNLEKEVITFAARGDIGLGGLLPTVRSTQLHGLEINPYAAELAQVVIWIGYLQWMRDNGFNVPRNPILEPLNTIECRDAILDLSDPAHPAPAQWPQAEFIIGNPPFLGSKLFRANGLPEEYVKALYAAYDLPKTSDLCCYWFEMARRYIEQAPKIRAGLLATQGIRGAASREVLQRIKTTASIFMSWSDREWILDGAAVHVSMIGFDSGAEPVKKLNGLVVTEINADLSSGADYRSAKKLSDNADTAFMADTKGGAFEGDWSVFRAMLASPNPNGKPNSDVMRPWINGRDVMKRCRGLWIIDYGCEMEERIAASYEGPFEYLRANVYPERNRNRRESYARLWWKHVEPRPAMREACRGHARVLGTAITSPHRVFVWIDPAVLPDHKIIVFARSDDLFFGVLQSSIHEIWSRSTGSQVREVESGFSYTPSESFETFPLPWQRRNAPPDQSIHQQVAEAAAELNGMRERWLNPPEWIDPIAGAIDEADDFADVPAEARPLIRQSAIMAAAAKDKNLKKRTLTNLYNERPTWLRLAHRKLDEAVLAAYAAVDPEGDWSSEWAAVWEDTGAGQPLPQEHPLFQQRAEVDQRVLANLLRLNQERSGLAQ